MDDGAQKPTIADTIAGLLFISGFMTLLMSLPLGVMFALPPHADGLPWTWTAKTSAVLTVIFIAFGFLLIYLAAAIWRCQWGYWPDIFWSSTKPHSDTDH